MSDCFDHEGDAVDRFLNGEGDEPSYHHTPLYVSGWKCQACGKWHPKVHLSCFWCHPPSDKDTNPKEILSPDFPNDFE